MPQILAIHRHMDDGPHMVAGTPLDTDGIHQFIVARTDSFPVYLGTHPPAGQFFHLAHPAFVDLFAIGLL